jgi:hypothetical protein
MPSAASQAASNDQGNEPEAAAGTARANMLTSYVNVPIIAPKITSIDPKDLIEWRKLRDEYVDRLKEEARNAGDESQWKKRCLSWKHSFDRDYLRTCACFLWGHARTSDCTEEEIRE